MTPLHPTLIQQHLADLRRAFELVARYEQHDIGKLPAALLDRLKANDYIIVGLFGVHYWTDDIYAFYVLYGAWQARLTEFITKGIEE